MVESIILFGKYLWFIHVLFIYLVSQEVGCYSRNAHYGLVLMAIELRQNLIFRKENIMGSLRL